MMAQAEMRAVPEGDLRIRRAIDEKMIAAGKYFLISIGGDEE